jgi:hypothetical protein
MLNTIYMREGKLNSTLSAADSNETKSYAFTFMHDHKPVTLQEI